jgi:hypothetical protein
LRFIKKSNKKTETIRTSARAQLTTGVPCAEGTVAQKLKIVSMATAMNIKQYTVEGQAICRLPGKPIKTAHTMINSSVLFLAVVLTYPTPFLGMVIFCRYISSLQ